MNLIDNYLDALARSLTRFDGVDDLRPVTASGGGALKRMAVAEAQRILSRGGMEVVRRHKFDAEKRMNGRDRPFNADTMVGVKRLENIRHAVRTVLQENIPGDLVETGVWRGGGSIMMRATLLAYGDRERTVWCADSFEGLPPPDLKRFPQDEGMVWHTEVELAIAQEVVERNFLKHNLLDDRVRFLKGWFKDTLPQAPINQIAVLRLDGDLYASTMDALNPLYDKVSVGGFIIVDDYGIPEDTCRRAIDDFRADRGITDEILDIDGWGCYWRKSTPAAGHSE
jgi:O-methyltransferase